MADCYQVQWSKTAQNDLSAVITYIQTTRPQAAGKLFADIKAQGPNLELLPELGRIVPELLSQGVVQYRELIIPPWRLLYRISVATVYVLAFIDARRNVEDILLDRFIRPKS